MRPLARRSAQPGFMPMRCNLPALAGLLDFSLRRRENGPIAKSAEPNT
jgi:hypothetical protein